MLLVTFNDEDRIGDLIPHYGPHVAEVLVVDNASSDATLSIARAAAAHLPGKVRVCSRGDRQGKRQRPISMIRNTGMASAASPWVLVVDPDEFLTAAALTQLSSLVSEGDHLGYFLPWRTYSADGRLVIDDYKLALLRLKRGIRFEGRIHENATASIRRLGGTCGRADAEIAHRPRVGDAMWKRKVYVQRLRQAIRAEPRCARLRWFLGLSYYKSGAVDPACQQFAMSYLAEDRGHPIERINSCFLMGYSQALSGDVVLGRTWLRRAAELCREYRGDVEMVAFENVMARIGRVNDHICNPKALLALSPSNLFYCY